MIRSFESKDMQQVLDIWLNASLLAHDFVPADFWKSRIEDMRSLYLPSSENYVFEDNSKVLGFLSLYENSLAAIFVNPKNQGKGIGQKLIKYAKDVRKELNLAVYAKNLTTIQFYLKCGFTATGESIDPHTGEKEILMNWTAPILSL